LFFSLNTLVNKNPTLPDKRDEPDQPGERDTRNKLSKLGSVELNYQTIFKGLNKKAIDYLVIGGLAVNFHGIPRMTYDIDLMILLEPENILKLVSKLTKWGYRPKVAVDPRDLADERKRNSWVQEKAMKALNFFSDTLPIGEIDLIIDSPIPYKELKQKAIKVEVHGEQIPVVSIRDLIELKLQAGRKQDLADVEHLKMILER
jgi:predicted nucleotidyltransferase